MPIEEQRYQVTQILAECRHKGVPTLVATMAVAAFFVKHEIEPPTSLLDWLGTDVQRPRVFN
jgi:hypothetical protein